MKRLTFIFVLLAMSLSCTKVYNQIPSPTSPTPVDTPPVVKADKIEFRVFGQDLAGNVVIKHTDPINGVTLYIGGAPYYAQVESTEDSVFLFIDAAGTGLYTNSGLQVQIFVNGKLFREAFSQGFNLSAQASGTFRR